MQALKLSLEGSVGVAQVEQLHASVHEAVQSGQAIELDLSQVRDIDGSILQLILATETATSQRGLDFALTGLSDSLHRLLTFNGAGAVLESVRTESESQLQDAEAVESAETPVESSGESSEAASVDPTDSPGQLADSDTVKDSANQETAPAEELDSQPAG